MEDDLRPRSADYRVHSLGRTDIRQDELERHARPAGDALGKLALDRPQGILVVVDHGDEARANGEDLADQLAADGTAAAGHENAHSVEVAGHGVGVDGDRLAAQQILHADPPDAARQRLTAEKLAGVRNGPDLQAQFLPALEGAPDGLSGGGRHGDQQLSGVGGVSRLWQCVETAEDALAEQSRALLDRVVVDEPDDVEMGRGVAGGHTSHRRAGFAGTVDDRRHEAELLVGAARETASFEAGPDGEASATDECDLEKRLQGEDGPWETWRTGEVDEDQAQERDDRDDRPDQDGEDDEVHLLDRGVAPLAAIQAEDDEDRRHGRERKEGYRHRPRQVLPEARQVEAEQEGQDYRDRRHGHVVDEEVAAPQDEVTHRSIPRSNPRPWPAAGSCGPGAPAVSGPGSTGRA